MKNAMKKCLLVFLVMNLVGIAVTLFLASGLGSDSIGLLCDGIRHVLPISFGNAICLLLYWHFVLQKKIWVWERLCMR